jgi:hypothetical protein
MISSTKRSDTFSGWRNLKPKKKLSNFPISEEVSLGLAWFRKIKKSELANEYKDTSSEIGKLLNFFFGLRFLQPEKVSERFVEEIMSIAPSDQRCATFVDYVLENYVSEKVKVSPIMWAEAPSGRRRTTKERESFHRSDTFSGWRNLKPKKKLSNFPISEEVSLYSFASSLFLILRNQARPR